MLIEFILTYVFNVSNFIEKLEFCTSVGTKLSPILAFSNLPGLAIADCCCVCAIVCTSLSNIHTKPNLLRANCLRFVISALYLFVGGSGYEYSVVLAGTEVSQFPMYSLITSEDFKTVDLVIWHSIVYSPSFFI